MRGGGGKGRRLEMRGFGGERERK
uniref:Uncharacterized protein n=1 Tax=Arundo donax TaxID=35708 RepID=A0A0A9CJ43_ARUDO